jgi:hypothetical protein
MDCWPELMIARNHNHLQNNSLVKFRWPPFYAKVSKVVRVMGP